MPRWIAFLLALLCLCLHVRASDPADTLEVSVITLGPGPIVYERFGHNALRVRSADGQFDAIYDWGNFDFHEPNFIGKFVKGSLLYSMDARQADGWIDYYRLDLDRTMTEQVLDLSAGQKRSLITALEANLADPKYLYDYYLDNCSTRVRDALDRTLDGQLSAQWDPRTLDQPSFRWHTRRLLDVGIENKAMSVLIDLSSGYKADVALSKWEVAFVPMELSKLLDQAMIRRADGTVVPLVRERRELNRTTSPGNAEPTGSRSTVRYALPAGIGLGLLMLAAARWARWLYWTLTASWSAFAAFGTLFFVVIIGFTRHWVVDWNENFLQFSPVSIGILAAALVPRWRKRLNVLPLAAASLSALGLAITISHLTSQQTAPAAALALPVHLAVLLGWTGAPKPTEAVATDPK